MISENISHSLIKLFTLFFLLTLTTTAQDDFECLDCHESLSEKTVHAVLDCADCHTDVKDEEHMEGGVKKVNCADCHSELAEVVKSDIHHRLTHIKMDPPTCKQCHGTHEVFPISSYKNITKTFCGSCHENMVLANPYHSKAVGSETCSDCHETAETVQNLSKSVHSFLNCSDCHNYISNNLEDHPGNFSISQKADCYLCHSDIAAIHRESIHGISIIEGVDESANCWNCHGSHNIVKVDAQDSPVSPTNLPQTCAACHDDPKLEEKFEFTVMDPASNYAMSVHAKIVEEGGEGPTCSSCHGVHNIKNVMQEGSTIAPLNIPNTCGKCHAEVEAEYKNSIHWIKAQKGVRLSPICNDCHSEHSIDAISGLGNKRHEIKLLQDETCNQCHQNPMVARRTGGGMEALQYRDSYHGMAVERGDEDAAMCVDCHGVHSILPKNYPQSLVSEENVTETCQKCHPNATKVFSQSYSHVSTSEEARKVEGIVTSLYFWMIILVIGGMVVHNLLIFVFEIRKRRQKSKNAITIPRFTKNEVVQHLFLLISFIVLAITGFALKYPDSWWSAGLHDLGMTETVRQNIHRISAVVMMAVGIYHIIYLFVTERGRDVLVNLLPRPDDIRNAKDNIFYYLRIKKKPPEFDKYDYTEKAEYWALIWGTIVMGVTGLILWFPTLVGDWAPVWLIKVSEIIHFYEAILASLAILVWHWFFVIFHPREYPMSFTWIDGKMSLQNYRHHHDKHFKKILLNWTEFRNGRIEKKKLTHSTKLFTSTLEKNNLDPDEIFEAELNNDYQLRAWLEEQIAVWNGGQKEEDEKK